MSKGCSQVVVVGGGFGGLQAVKTLACADVDVTLIDRNIYHLFQPLSYQVATGSLSPAEIAVPLRQIFRHEPRVRVVMGEVSGFDLKRREVLVDSTVPGSSSLMIPYDTLLVAGGSSYCYFGHERWRSLALEVKSLDSSLRVRGRILQAFEAAELERDPQLQASWLTFVVVGAGPTGVEMAGQIAELARYTLPAEFRDSDPRAGQVLLVETADRVLTALHPLLSQRASRSLQKLGVTPLLSHTLVRRARGQRRAPSRQRHRDPDPHENRHLGSRCRGLAARERARRALRRRTRSRRPPASRAGPHATGPPRGARIWRHGPRSRSPLRPATGPSRDRARRDATRPLRQAFSSPTASRAAPQRRSNTATRARWRPSGARKRSPRSAAFASAAAWPGSSG